MKNNLSNKGFILFLCILITGSAFLLSAVGKIISIEVFKSKMPDYGLPEFTAYAIVAAELVIAVFLMTDLYLKFIYAGHEVWR